MNKLKAFDVAIRYSKATQSVYVIYENGFNDFGVSPQEEYYGDTDLIIATFYNGTREI